MMAAEEFIPGFGSIQRFYAATRSMLPSFIAERLPSLEREVSVAPVPGYPTLTPKLLKQAMILLASEGKLTKLPDSDTPNLLVFNNATKA